MAKIGDIVYVKSVAGTFKAVVFDIEEGEAPRKVSLCVGDNRNHQGNLAVLTEGDYDESHLYDNLPDAYKAQIRGITENLEGLRALAAKDPLFENLQVIRSSLAQAFKVSEDSHLIGDLFRVNGYYNTLLLDERIRSTTDTLSQTQRKLRDLGKTVSDYV